MKLPSTWAPPMQCITGLHYRAISCNSLDWLIMRHSFEMGRFTGTPEEMKQELVKWDQTVQSHGA